MPHSIPRNKLKEFEQYASGAMQQWQVPGMAIAIVENDRLIFAKGFGFKETSGTDPIDNSTVFQIGSVSKSFTAALVAMLVDEGKIKWQDKVRTHLPGFRLSDSSVCQKFLIEDLMSQCSGLPPYSGRFLPHLGFSRKDIIQKLRFIKPIGNYRFDYAYQNHLFLVAASLIEKYTGQSWKQALAYRILAPLKMSHTTASHKGYLNSVNRSCGHYYDGPIPANPIKPLPLNWPYHYWVYTIGPAGGINSNVLDMAMWLKLQLKGGIRGRHRLISERNCKFIHTPKTPAGVGVWGESRYYCQGWVQSNYDPYPIIWHNGGTSGMKSILAMVPSVGIGIVILCNLHDSLLPEVLARVFFDYWFEHPYQDWSNELLEGRKSSTVQLQASPAPETPSRPLVYYIGTYFNDLYGYLSVTKTGGKLTITIGPKKITWPLKHWGGDTFVFYWPGVLTDGACVQFNADRSGKIKSLTIEGMNDNVSGVFRKIRKIPEARFIWF